MSSPLRDDIRYLVRTRKMALNRLDELEALEAVADAARALMNTGLVWGHVFARDMDEALDRLDKARNPSGRKP